MFTGIIQAVGSVVSLAPLESGVRLVVDPKGWGVRVNEGDSVSVSGCCLTCAPRAGDGEKLGFDVVHETLRKTTLGSLRPGSPVNLEPSLAVGERIGGHFVQGHVDGVARVESIETSGGEHIVTLMAGDEVMRYVVPLGSVTLDGASLTVARVRPDRRAFTVALIPTTLDRTTLRNWKPGEGVNIETDILARSVAHYLERGNP